MRVPCSSSSHQWGDNWNLEDLSLWSPDDTKAGAPEDGAPRVKQVEPAETVIARPDFERSPSTQGLMSPSASSGLDTVGAASSASAPSTAAARPLGQRFHLDRDVLTNGARAVGAFSRPFPAATFGVPKRVDFDIKRASFKLTVEVPAGDAMAADGPPTEVFLPWVHYASVERFAADPAAPPVVFRGDAKSGARPRPAEAGSSTSSRSGSPASSVTKAARKVETVTVENLADSTWSGETATVTAMAHGQQQQRQHQQTTTAILPPFELDLEVSVSGGRYEVEGQTLRWWYHPTAAAKPASYTLTVKRRGGARKEMVHPLGQASAAWNVSLPRRLSALPGPRLTLRHCPSSLCPPGQGAVPVVALQPMVPLQDDLEAASPEEVCARGRRGQGGPPDRPLRRRPPACLPPLRHPLERFVQRILPTTTLLLALVDDHLLAGRSRPLQTVIILLPISDFSTLWNDRTENAPGRQQRESKRGGRARCMFGKGVMQEAFERAGRPSAGAGWVREGDAAARARRWAATRQNLISHTRRPDDRPASLPTNLALVTSRPPSPPAPSPAQRLPLPPTPSPTQTDARPDGRLPAAHARVQHASSGREGLQGRQPRPAVALRPVLRRQGRGRGHHRRSVRPLCLVRSACGIRSGREARRQGEGKARGERARGEQRAPGEGGRRGDGRRPSSSRPLHQGLARTKPPRVPWTLAEALRCAWLPRGAGVRPPGLRSRVGAARLGRRTTRSSFPPPPPAAAITAAALVPVPKWQSY